VAVLQEFARDTRYAALVASRQPDAGTVSARLAALLRSEVDLGWFDRLFGQQAGAAFRLAPGLCNAIGSFGPRLRTSEGADEFWAVISVGQPDSTGIPRFGRGIVPTIIHEFAHSFVNPIVQARFDRFAPAAEAVFTRVSSTLQAQAYGDARTVLNETLVRASVARYLRASRGPAAARDEIERQMGLGFVWLDAVDARLNEFEADRSRYHTFASFQPRFAAFWDSVPAMLDSMIADLDSRRPRVLASAPGDSSVAVDPATSVMTVRFDRAMRAGFALHRVSRDGLSWPEASAPRWDETRTIVSFDIRLEPSRDYGITLSGSGFVSESGVPAATKTIVFRARPGPQ
jgi:hypothetical protein